MKSKQFIGMLLAFMLTITFIPSLSSIECFAANDEGTTTVDANTTQNDGGDIYDAPEAEEDVMPESGSTGNVVDNKQQNETTTELEKNPEPEKNSETETGTAVEEPSVEKTPETPVNKPQSETVAEPENNIIGGAATESENADQADAEETDTVTDETNIKWELTGDEGDKTLTIGGNGAMDDYETASASPWYSERQNITKVVIEDGITHIGDRAFYNCSNLVSVEISDSVESIGSWAFYNLSALKVLTIPANVSSLGNSSIRACTLLSEVYFCGNAPSIGSYNFTNCSEDLTIYAHTGTTGWDSTEWTNLPVEIGISQEK